ncbi:MAG: hydrogenase 3 maturation endopeptidase HyCI [Candidatus Omnitrophota bacterium]
MQTLTEILRERIKKAKRVAVLGIGSQMRGDDAAGMLIAQQLDKEVKSSRLKVFFGESVPENIAGSIKKFAPDYLIIIDSADMGKPPGEISMLDPAQCLPSASFSTHRMPVCLLTDFLTFDISCPITLIGIQPKTIEFGKPPAEEVVRSAKNLAEVIKGLIDSNEDT